MADLAARTIFEVRPRAGRQSFIIADSVVLVEGALVGLEGGFLNHWADGAADVFAGIVLGGDARANDGVLTGETSDTKPPEGFVDTSGVELMHVATLAGTPTQAKVGDLVYCSTSNLADITLTIGALNHPIGYMSRFRSATDVDIVLFTPTEMLAQATA